MLEMEKRLHSDMPASRKGERMELHNFEELMHMSSSMGKKCTMAVAGAGIASAIDAVLDAYDNKVADAILVGEKDTIRSLLRERGRNPADFNIVQTVEGQNPAETAVEIIKKGDANQDRTNHISCGILPTSFLSQIIDHNRWRRLCISGS